MRRRNEVSPQGNYDACMAASRYCSDDAFVCTGCLECCQVTKFSYEQVATRENEDFQHVIMPATSSISFKTITLTELKRKYSGTKSASCSAGECGSCGCPCGDCAGLCAGLCSGLCKPCFYIGNNRFSYAEDSSQKNTMDQLTRKEAGHDDDTWSAMDDALLLSLTTAAKTKHLFQNPDSAQCRALLVRHFGTRFSAEQCLARLENLNKNLKTTDKCTSTAVRAVKITHWDVACQKVRASGANFRHIVNSTRRQDLESQQCALFVETIRCRQLLTMLAAGRCGRQCVCAILPKWAPTTSSALRSVCCNSRIPWSLARIRRIQ